MFVVGSLQDWKAEELNILDGSIDLRSCYEILEINISKKYGFKIKVLAVKSDVLLGFNFVGFKL